MIYLNFIHAPSGGGLQNAASFLQTLIDSDNDLEDFCCLVFKNSILEDVCREHSVRHVSVRNGRLGKLIFELFYFLRIKNGDIVFSIFGPPLPFTSGRSVNVGGMAISNVFYPDVDFWGFLPKYKKILKQLKDRYRVFRYKKLDFWIFETELLAEKAIKEFNFPRERVSVVKMAPSALVSKDRVTGRFLSKFDSGKVNILMLCGAHPNKRHHLLPRLAFYLKSRGYFNIKFIFTSSPNEYLDSVNAEIEHLDVSEYFSNVGPVAPESVAELIDSVDYMMNISLLESFSNNFVEAWAMEKPLITVFDEWASCAAGDAALYVRVLEGQLDFESFISAINYDRNTVVSKGRETLSLYPTASQKSCCYMQVINNARLIGSLSKEVRGRIKL